MSMLPADAHKLLDRRPPPKPASPPYAVIYEWDTPGGLHQDLYPGTYNGLGHDRRVPVFAKPDPDGQSRAMFVARLEAMKALLAGKGPAGG